jgi:hypothetical protein
MRHLREKDHPGFFIPQSLPPTVHALARQNDPQQIFPKFLHP